MTVLYRHIKQLMEEQEEWIAALIEEDTKRLPMGERSVRSRTISLLSQLFTIDDWNELARIAAQEMSQTAMQVQQAVSDKLPTTA